MPNSDTIISLSLRGDLFYCNAAAPGKPSLEIKGHNKSINAMAVDRSTGTIVSGSYDGVVNRFTIGQSAAAALVGKGHTNAIVDLILTQGKLLSCGMDDTLRVSNLSDMQYSPEVTRCPFLSRTFLYRHPTCSAGRAALALLTGATGMVPWAAKPLFCRTLYLHRSCLP